MTFNSKMHERNIYKTRPDFAQIAMDFPVFRKYAIPNAKGKVYVDFSDTEALRTLTTILLKKDFNLDVEIPRGFLVPTIPQRLNYILWVEDLLSQYPQANKNINGIDIGTGPCAIFSLLGSRKNGWNFTATESSDDALRWARRNIKRNNLNSKINVVKVSQDTTLKEVLSADKSCYQFCLCNPPFFENPGEIRNKHQNTRETLSDVAQIEEICFKGGELEFVRNILKDSLVFKHRICLFTSMFGKKSSFVQIHKELKEMQNVIITTTEFCQGNTVRWGIAWTFDDSIQFEEEKKKEKPRKAKRPLEYEIPIINPKTFMLDHVLRKTQGILNELEICVTTVKSTNNYAELSLKSDKNTWTHQRRRRRALERQKKISKDSKGIPSGEKLAETADDVSSKLGSSSEEIICSENLNSEASTTTKSEDTEHKDSGHTSVIHAGGANEKLINADLEQETGNKLCPGSVTESETSHNKEEVDSTQISSCCSSSFADDNVSPNKKRKLDSSDEHPVQMKKVKLDEPLINVDQEPKTGDKLCPDQDTDTDPVYGSVLNCKLQLIKGKNKVYVKMNCLPGADRNTLYQVFQVFKNKIN